MKKKLPFLFFFWVEPFIRDLGISLFLKLKTRLLWKEVVINLMLLLFCRESKDLARRYELFFICIWNTWLNKNLNVMLTWAFWSMSYETKRIFIQKLLLSQSCSKHQLRSYWENRFNSEIEEIVSNEQFCYVVFVSTIKQINCQWRLFECPFITF